MTKRRCKVTGNPCGTDTWPLLAPCKCVECQAFVSESHAYACRIAADAVQQMNAAVAENAKLREMLAQAADHLETATHVVVDEGVFEERAFVEEIRRAIHVTPPRPSESLPWFDTCQTLDCQAWPTWRVVDAAGRVVRGSYNCDEHRPQEQPRVDGERYEHRQPLARGADPKPLRPRTGEEP